MALHSHYDHGHSDGDAAAAAGISAGMMIAVLGFIAAAVIVIAMLVWTPWDNNDGNRTNNITNNPVPSQQTNPGTSNNNSGGGTNSLPGGSNGSGSNSGGSSSGSGTGSSSSSGGSSSNTPR